MTDVSEFLLPPDDRDLVIYLAGAMRKAPGFGIPLFTQVTAILREQGYVVVPPHEIMHGGDSHFNPAFTHQDYIREDIRLGLSKCNAICLLPGWTQSEGARDYEFPYAVEHGYEIYFFDMAWCNLIRMDEILSCEVPV